MDSVGVLGGGAALVGLGGGTAGGGLAKKVGGGCGGGVVGGLGGGKVVPEVPETLKKASVIRKICSYQKQKGLLKEFLLHRADFC